MSNSTFTDIRLQHQGRDSFINIFRAKRMGRWFALKALKPEYADNPKLQALLKREFVQGYNLHHPAVAETYGFEDVPGVGRAIVTEWVEGIPLESAVANHKLDERHVVRIAESLASYLDYIHSMQAIHKTLRPADIMLSHNGWAPKIVDFGFAEAAMGVMAGTSAGPRRYLSPELINGDRGLDEATDTYSLGKIISDMNQSLRDPSKHLSKIAAKCTRPNPADRYYRYGGIEWHKAPSRSGMMWLMAILGIIAGSAITYCVMSLATTSGAAEAPAPVETIHDTLVVEAQPLATADTAKMRFLNNIDRLVSRVTDEEWTRMVNLFEDYASSSETPDRSMMTNYWDNVNTRVERRLQAMIDDNMRPGDCDYRLVRLGILSLARQQLQSLRDDTESQRRLKEAFDKINFKD